MIYKELEAFSLMERQIPIGRRDKLEFTGQYKTAPFLCGEHGIPTSEKGERYHVKIYR